MSFLLRPSPSHSISSNQVWFIILTLKTQWSRNKTEVMQWRRSCSDRKSRSKMLYHTFEHDWIKELNMARMWGAYDHPAPGGTRGTLCLPKVSNPHSVDKHFHHVFNLVGFENMLYEYFYHQDKLFWNAEWVGWAYGEYLLVCWIWSHSHFFKEATITEALQLVVSLKLWVPLLCFVAGLLAQTLP